MFGRTKATPAMSLFFATDIHGSEQCFTKFLRASDFYEVDGLILGGDLTGKVIAPLIAEPDGSYSAEYLGEPVKVVGTEGVSDLERRLRLNGFYPFRCLRDEYDELNADPDKRAKRMAKVVREDITRWAAVADERLAAASVPCVAIPGNDDDDEVGEVLNASRLITNADGTVVDFGDFQVLGLGYSNPTPWNSPRELSEEELGERLLAAGEKLDPARPTIFNVHVPPHASGLDTAPELNEDLSLASAGGMQSVAVGSTAVTEAIKRFQPVVSLHGHVHESRGAFRIGNTLCLNPGSEYNTGVLRGVIVRLSVEKALSYQFVAA
jgi:uncharacterized protein